MEYSDKILLAGTKNTYACKLMLKKKTLIARALNELSNNGRKRGKIVP